MTCENCKFNFFESSRIPNDYLHLQLVLRNVPIILWIIVKLQKFYILGCNVLHFR